MGKPTITFSKLVDKLQQHYGAPAPPPSTDHWNIICENIAYLASDKRLLKDAPSSNEPSEHAQNRFVLLSIPLWRQEFDSDLRAALKKPLPQAKKALKRFPSIGDPGAEKILLFTRLLRQHGQELCKRQSRSAPNVRSEIAATIIGRFDRRFPKQHKA